jgi:hypothetical protein
MIERPLLFLWSKNLHGISQANILHLSPKQRGERKKKMRVAVSFLLGTRPLRRNKAGVVLGCCG